MLFRNASGSSTDWGQVDGDSLLTQLFKDSGCRKFDVYYLVSCYLRHCNLMNWKAKTLEKNHAIFHSLELSHMAISSWIRGWGS